MKYAHEIIELMGAYPGRDFKMAEIVRYITWGKQRVTVRERQAIRESARVVLLSLATSGSIAIHYPKAVRGSFALYRWCQSTG